MYQTGWMREAKTDKTNWLVKHKALDKVSGNLNTGGGYLGANTRLWCKGCGQKSTTLTPRPTGHPADSSVLLLVCDL